MIANPLSRLPYPDAARNLLRHTVISAVDELVRADGWASTSLTAVAKAAGVSRQTLYNEFGNRRSIAEAYIVHHLDILLDELTLELESGNDLSATLRDGFTRFFDIADVPLVQMALAADNADVIELVRVANERATTRLAALFRQVKPSIARDDAIAFADAIARVAVAHAVAPTIPPDEAVDRLVRLASALIGPAVDDRSATGS